MSDMDVMGRREIMQLVRLMVAAVVNETDKVLILETEQGVRVTLTVHVAEGDVGKVIGKQGRTAKSLRTILLGASQKAGLRYELVIAETERLPCLVKP